MEPSSLFPRNRTSTVPSTGDKRICNAMLTYQKVGTDLGSGQRRCRAHRTEDLGPTSSHSFSNFPCQTEH